MHTYYTLSYARGSILLSDTNYYIVLYRILIVFMATNILQEVDVISTVRQYMSAHHFHCYQSLFQTGIECYILRDESLNVSPDVINTESVNWRDFYDDSTIKSSPWQAFQAICSLLILNLHLSLQNDGKILMICIYVNCDVRFT